MNTLQLPDEFILPDYSGGTLANVPGTVAALLKAPFKGLPPLRETLWRPLGGDVQRVVVLLLDSLGWNLFQQERRRLRWLTERAVIEGKITSVFPSTTVAALSSLWTGFAPAQHGLVGLRLFFPNQAVLGQLLSFSPTFAKYPGSLIDAGLKPESFLNVPGFATQLANAGIPSHSFKSHGIVRSALSLMHDRGVAVQHGTVSPADMFVQLHTLLEETSGAPLFANAYWPSIDTLSHIYGPLGQSVVAECHSLFDQLRRWFLDRLSKPAAKGTVLIITADHGQVPTPPDRAIAVEDHPRLKQMLLMRTAGEPRTAYLYARQGQVTSILSYLNHHLSDALAALPSAEALAGGLLGPEPHAPDAAGRLGDILATMRHGHVLLNPDETDRAAQTLGRHGGLTADEMEVPWLGFRLDA